MALDFVADGEEGGVATLDFQPDAESKPALDFVEDEAQPQGNLGDFMRQPGAGAVETSPVTPGVLPEVGGALSGAEGPGGFPGRELAERPSQDVEIGAGKAIEVPRFGEPGTVARGASDTLAGLAEWALNKPEEALATFTLVEPAILARYGPEIVKQFVGDVKAGLGGDREAIGRALTMGALVGGPRVFKKAREEYLQRGEAKGPVTDVDLAAVEALRPKSPVEAATGVETKNVLPGAAEVFERVVVEPAVEVVRPVERPVTKGAVDITKEPVAEEPAPAPSLTPDAVDLLTNVEAGAAPGFFSDRFLRRVAEENGVEVGDKTTPNEIVEALRNKRAEGEKGQDASKVSEAAEVHGDVLKEAESADRLFISPNALPDAAMANTETWYHGGNAVIKEPSSSFSKIEGLLGTGFYMTDDPAVAKTYARGPRGTLHEAKVDVRRVVNMEKPLEPDVASVLSKSVYPEFRDVIEQGVSEGKSGMDVWKSLTQAVEDQSHGDMVPASEYSEMYQTIEGNLRDLGVDALTHIGGQRAGKGKRLHRVLILLDPQGEYGAVDRQAPKTVRSIEVAGKERVGTKQASEVTPAKRVRVGEETRGAQERVPVEEGGERVRAGATQEAIDFTPDEPGPGLVGLGGATPSEFTPAAGRTTGIKNASIDLQRQERGLEPVMKPLREGDTEVWDRAMAKMDADYTTPERLGVQDRLIEELRQRPRAATPEEDVMLLQRMADYRNELDRAQAAVKLAEKDGRELDAEAARARADEWHERLGELEAITELSGTHSGRSLAARKMIMGADYTLERMERQFKKAGGEEPFTKEQREGVAKDQAQIDALKKQLEEREARLAEETAARVRAELNVRKDGTANVPEHIMRIVRKVGEVLDKRAQAARVRLRGKVFTLSPELLKDLAEVGAANIYHVGVDTAVWGARMVEELGERVRPHLDTIFEAAKKLVDEAAVEVAGRKPRQARTAAAASMTAKDPEARRLEQWKKRTVDAIVKLEERMEKGDFSKRTRREVQLDEEARKLAFELHEAKRKWNQKVFERQLEAEGPGAKAVRRLGEASNTARSVLGSVDLSAVLRQGKFAVMTNPVLGARAIPAMLRALLSEKKAFEIEREIAERPNAQRYKRAGLALTEADYTLSKMEEQFMGRWAMDPLHFARNVAPRTAEAVRKLNPVAASARAYQVFLNKLRADVFDTLVEGLERKGGDIAAQDKVIANAVNVFTGRGSLGKGEQAAQALNTWFWAPKFVASRFQALLGQPLWRGKWKDTGAARAIVARQYAKLLTNYAILYSLAIASGVKVGTQMDGTDWGKWIFGKTRLDPLAGVSQASVFLTRVIKGTTTTLAGKRKNLRGQRKYGDKDVPGVMLDFGRSKLAPLPGGIVDALAGEDFLHRPVTPRSVLLRYTVPISLQDIASTMKEQGVPAGTAFTLLSIMGEGVATYDDFEKKK